MPNFWLRYCLLFENISYSSNSVIDEYGSTKPTPEATSSVFITGGLFEGISSKS